MRLHSRLLLPDNNTCATNQMDVSSRIITALFIKLILVVFVFLLSESFVCLEMKYIWCFERLIDRDEYKVASFYIIEAALRGSRLI